MKPARQPATLEDPHELSILAALGDARSHFKVLPVSRNTLYVRRYRHRLRLARLAAADAADTATNNDGGPRRRSATVHGAVMGNDAIGPGSMSPGPNPA
jgi:hypothetical protein